MRRSALRAASRSSGATCRCSWASSRALGGVDLTLTTNGALLARQAERLADAGLTRVTVSLDSLDDDVFRAMNDVDFPVARVLEGIDAAAAAGLPVKVNVVVKRGLNDGSVLDLARHFRPPDTCSASSSTWTSGTRTAGGSTTSCRPPRSSPPSTPSCRSSLSSRSYRGEVAQRYRYRDGSGEIGVIACVTQPFCGDCTRARLSADGKLYTCLFAVRGHDLRGRALRRFGRGARGGHRRHLVGP